MHAALLCNSLQFPVNLELFQKKTYPVVFWGYEKEELEIWGNPRKEPNIWVFTLMTDALGLPIDDIDLDLRIHMNRTAIRAAFHNTSTD